MSKTIFVTGAASGIGKATSLLFGRKGWRGGCYDGDLDRAPRVAERLPTAVHGRIDVTSEESWKTAVADFVGGAGALDVLFNCAGILRMGRFEAVSAADRRKPL